MAAWGHEYLSPVTTAQEWQCFIWSSNLIISSICLNFFFVWMRLCHFFENVCVLIYFNILLKWFRSTWVNLLKRVITLLRPLVLEFEHVVLLMTKEWWETIYIYWRGFTCQFLSHIIHFFLRSVCVMISFFTSIFKSENVVEGNSPPLMNVTMHPSNEFSDMSNLSATNVVAVLNLVRMDWNSDENRQKCIEKCLHEVNQSVGRDIRNSFKNLQKCMEKGQHEVNIYKKVKKSQSRLLTSVGRKCKISLIADGVEYVALSIDVIREKSDF